LAACTVTQPDPAVNPFGHGLSKTIRPPLHGPLTRQFDTLCAKKQETRKIVQYKYHPVVPKPTKTGVFYGFLGHLGRLSRRIHLKSKINVDFWLILC
jgi:hypothetical protein